eukprot:TRINITY_DN11161_c0_g1_i1.p1 TRINITY_DN11161_c0_g1~~TRINITY_DN11161_c0_g1_i1.p1  ORF type:complete len:173 (+),score=60.19 TRINITY_DN11161_c0_g1_i1:72-521(+)
MSYSAPQVAEFKQAFSLYDTAGTGSIAVEQLGTVMRAVGKCPSGAEIRDIVAQYEFAEGTIDFATFITIMEANKDNFNKTEEDIQSAFRMFDKQNTGTVSCTEFKHIITSIGETFTPEEVDAFIAEADCGNGTINYVEYCKVLAPPIAV